MYKVSYFIFISLMHICMLYGSRETEEYQAEKSDVSSEREVFESAKFFTKASTVVTTRTTTEVYFKDNAPKGPFYNFIVNVCKILINNFSNSRIPKYLKILSKSLRHRGSGFLMRKVMRKFSKIIKTLSAFRGEFVKIQINHFLQFATENKPRRYELFAALNPIFTESLERKMDDYIYQLKRYGTKSIRHIDKMTRKVFDYVIFYTISKQEDIIKGNILLKFKLAVVEYLQDKLQNGTTQVY